MRPSLTLLTMSLTLLLPACTIDDERSDLIGRWHGETRETIHYSHPLHTTRDRYEESITLEPHTEDDERVFMRYSPTCAIEGADLGDGRVLFEPHQCDLASEDGARTIILSGEASLSEDGELTLALEGDLLEVRAREVVLEAHVALTFRGSR